jgi:hypothetical protein
VEWKW